MTDKEIPNDILRMFETGIDLALIPRPRPCYHDDLTAAEAMFDDDRVLQIINDTTINEARRLAFEQQTKIGWSRLFLGLMTVEWSRSTAKLEHQWTSSCARLFLEWGRACWTHRNYYFLALHRPDANNDGSVFRPRHWYGLLHHQQNHWCL